MPYERKYDLYKCCYTSEYVWKSDLPPPVHLTDRDVQVLDECITEFGKSAKKKISKFFDFYRGVFCSLFS